MQNSTMGNPYIVRSVDLNSFYFPDKTAIRGGAEIGLLSLRLSVSRGPLLEDFLLAPYSRR